MKPEEFKKTILDSIQNIGNYIKFDDYDNNSYSSFTLELKDMTKGFLELKIDNVEFYFHYMEYNGFTQELGISDKYSNLNGNLVARIHVDNTNDVELKTNLRELLL